MSCCGLEMVAYRNADLRKTFTPPSGYTFSTFTAEMQIRASEGAAGSPLLEISITPTANGSVFTIVGSSLVLTIEGLDTNALPNGSPTSDPDYFVYDIIITDGSGFKTRLCGGPFIVKEGVTRD